MIPSTVVFSCCVHWAFLGSSWPASTEASAKRRITTTSKEDSGISWIDLLNWRQPSIRLNNKEPCFLSLSLTNPFDAQTGMNPFKASKYQQMAIPWLTLSRARAYVKHPVHFWLPTTSPQTFVHRIRCLLWWSWVNSPIFFQKWGLWLEPLFFAQSSDPFLPP